MKVARIITTHNCLRNCEMCCNKQARFRDIPKFGDLYGLSKYDQVVFTGGEPMMYPSKLIDLIRKTRNVSSTIEIFINTAWFKNNFADLITVIRLTDGITVTIHNQKDVEDFEKFNNFLMASNMPLRSLRLNVFKGIDISKLDLHLWKVKEMEWLEDCPLPENEELFVL